MTPANLRRIGTHHTFFENRPDLFPLMVFSPDNEVESPTPHTHDFGELVYIRKGRALHVRGTSRYPVTMGDCYYIAPGEPDGYLERENLCLTNVLFYKEIFGSFMEDARKIPGFIGFFSIEPLFRSESLFRYKLHLDTQQQFQIQELLSQLGEKLDSALPGYQLDCAGIFFQIVAFICRRFTESLNGTQGQVEFAAKEAATTAAQKYLQDNFRKSLTVREIAGIANLSPAYLSRLFKKATGASMLDYMTKFRIDEACRLLKESVLSVKEIAFQVGFHDAAYFSRVFQRLLHSSPSEYRNKTLTLPRSAR
jgi:AraC-like DNA-binding protein